MKNRKNILLIFAICGFLILAILFLTKYIQEDKISIDIEINGVISDANSEEYLYLDNTVENCMIENPSIFNSKMIFLYDKYMKGNIYEQSYNHRMNYLINNEKQLADGGFRFPYYYRNDDNYIVLTQDNYNIYYRLSQDLENYTEPKVCLYNNDANYLWNAAVAQNNDGKYYFIVEMADNIDQSDVKIGTYISDDLDFNNDYVSTLDMANGGNPWITYIDGKGFLAVYGVTDNDGYWRIGAAVLPDGKDKWITATKDVFYIGYPKIHICDPELKEVNGNTIITFSYDQNKTIVCKTNSSYEDIFNSIIKEEL